VSRVVGLAPEVALVLTAITLFVMMPGGSRRAPLVVVVVGGVVALAAAVATLGVGDEFLYVAYRVDAFSQAAKAVVLAGMLLAVGVGGAAARPEPLAEDYFFLVAAALGLSAAASLADTLALFLALEIASAAMVALAGLGSLADGHRGCGRLVRTSLAPSALGALGLALLTGATGATRLADVTAALAGDAPQPAALAGAALVLAGLLVRWGAAPFYAWCPWLMRDSSPLVALFAGTALWAGVGAVIVRLVLAFAPLGRPLALFVAGAAAVAILYGMLNARPRRDARCLLSYLSVVQAGLVLTALVVPGVPAAAAALVAILVVVVAQTTVMLMLAGTEGGGSVRRPADADAVPRRAIAVSVPLVVGLIALAALPPTAGFTSRRHLLGAAWDEGWWGLVLVGLVASAALTGLALVAVPGLLGRGAPAGKAATPGPARAAVIVAWALAILLLVFGLVPGPLDRGAEALARFVG
jgi:NADH-quinone oxidoreductase subunit N